MDRDSILNKMVCISDFASILEIVFGICTLVVVFELMPLFTSQGRTYVSQLKQSSDKSALPVAYMLSISIVLTLIGCLLFGVFAIVLLLLAGAKPEFEVPFWIVLVFTVFGVIVVPTFLFVQYLLLDCLRDIKGSSAYRTFRARSRTFNSMPKMPSGEDVQ